MGTFFLRFVLCVSVFSFFRSSISIDSITQSQNLTDGSTLVSKNGTFELGFFSPGTSKNRYLGIWYTNISVQTIVWVANRDIPINDSSGILVINSSGNIILLGQNNTVWSAARLLKQVQNPRLQLLDTGNLVLRDEQDENSETNIWQSFDYPTDVLLPGMKLGWDLKNHIDRRLIAWRNPNDPSPGNLSWRMELHEYPETVMWNGSREYFRLGPWNGLRVTGKPPAAVPILKFNQVSNENEVYYAFDVINKALTVMMVLNQSNYMREMYLRSGAEKTWRFYASVPRDYCDNYALCGYYGYCDISVTPACKCLQGFRPKSPEKWKLNDFTDGCEREKSLNCQDNVGFFKFTGLKLPDTTHSWVNESMSLDECKAKCFSNCSCMAYANKDIRGGGSGCVVWFGDLLDLKFVPSGGQDLHVRMPASEFGKINHDSLKVKVGVAVAATIALVSATVFVGVYICRRRTNSKEGENEELELPTFDLPLITRATDNFSNNNKLGEGGFGVVYRGRLLNGQEIAVKRLSQGSGQGANEFKNEVILIAKLQHRNLVKLLGCCIQGEEKMLIYEYMPNKSLDNFIFNKTRGKLLDWSMRFHIICGIARGLLYLHQDSRLRIIHRDLKASNVLLDVDMNPKISDFGLARTFGGDQTEANTRRVVGTYGYMAPEYAINGQFSIKSDVFSFGILLLEIVSGKRNRGSYHPNNNLNLIGYAWRLWKEGRPAELIDENIGETCTLSEVLRCIHISLLSLQQYPDDRPTMSSVVLMLGSGNSLPQPKQPGLLMESSEMDCLSSKDQWTSTNELTITQPEAR